jgi:hypothetical protein
LAICSIGVCAGVLLFIVIIEVISVLSRTGLDFEDILMLTGLVVCLTAFVGSIGLSVSGSNKNAPIVSREDEQ